MNEVVNKDMIDSDKRKSIVTAFLRRCNDYADRELARYLEQLGSTTDAAIALSIQDKLVHWSAYKAFNDVALTEITHGQLDEWFVE